MPPSSNPTTELADYESFFDLSSFTPTQLSQVLISDDALLSAQTAILIGGSALSPALEAEIITFSDETITPFWETYGMTETASHIALKRIGTDSYFKPQPGVEVSTNEHSQLCIAIPELNFNIITNDIARLHSDGFEIIGRADDVINSGGIKIHPAIIEPKIKKILKDSGIERLFYITKKEDAKLGEKAVLVIEGPPLKEANSLLKVLKHELPKYHHPKLITFLDKIEYTDTGKLKRLPL